ncbi:Oxygen regulatory protein NreC [Aquisphaera giovannonii]|uniref:Oxygen regulatory protein NreC n=1 Tax=Aquisphaera giovannonii TaxID=406548 RepID=A0A5B9VZE8_9BACT|nr:response regulator transcription factor [Aquisphaera giovannonii]QEH33429.1 Oxygen regulatory protein NreC [Aquisphaera giovannonii]
MGKLRVVLADDHAVVREGLKALIDAQPDLEVVGEAADGETACRKAEELRPDVLVMDVSMPRMSGVEATERLRQSRPELRILALTLHEDKGHLRRMLQAGASGYILKLATGEELLRALRVVAAGAAYLDPLLAGKLAGELVRDGQGAEGTRRSPLTDREGQVLLQVARGFSNKEIAAQLDISVKTVETHKLRAMEKLGLRGRADVVQHALREGWLASD